MGKLKREEIRAHECYFRVLDAFWQRTEEHVVKLFDSETCRLAIKLNEISFYLLEVKCISITELGCVNWRKEVIEINTLFWEFL